MPECIPHFLYRTASWTACTALLYRRRYMAELLIGLAQLTAGSLQARPLQEAEHEVAQEVLPPPIIPGNYDKKAASCLMSVSWGAWVVGGSDRLP